MFNLLSVALYILIVGILIFFKWETVSKPAIYRKLFYYFLIIPVALPLIICGILQTLHGNDITSKISWLPSPFRTEVGLHDVALGILALLAVWIRGTFCHAAILGWAYFMIYAGVNYYLEISKTRNFTEYNLLIIFYDIGIALFGILLWQLWMKSNHIRFWYKAKK